MKRKRVLCTLLAFLLLAGLPPSARAADMTAAITKGAVTLNDWTIDNSAAEYPLLLYRDITYFPMTYHLCRLLGLVTDWDNDARILRIDKSGEIADYVPDTGGSHKSQSVSVTPVGYKVIVNGTEVDNSKEEWPLFNYNGVTYFPLTWAFAVEEFGWEYAWDAENGLRIDCSSSPDAEDAQIIMGIQRAIMPSIYSSSPDTLELELKDDWTLEGIRRVIADGLREYHKDGFLKDCLTGVEISTSFQFPADLKAGITLTVPYTASYILQEETVLPSGKTYKQGGSAGEKNASILLTGQGAAALETDSAFQAGQDLYRRLEACINVPDQTVTVGTRIDAIEYMWEILEENLREAGLSEQYSLSTLSVSAAPDEYKPYQNPGTLAAGQSVTLYYSAGFYPRTVDMPPNPINLDFAVTFSAK